MMQNNQDWNQQYGSQYPTQSYPNEPPPSYDMAMGQDSRATAPTSTYKTDIAPTAPPAALPYMVSDGHVYSFPQNNGVCAAYPTQSSQPYTPYTDHVNHPCQPPGTQQTIMVGTPVPPPDGPLVVTQQKNSAKRTCTGLSAGLVILFILLWILFKFFIRIL